MDIGSGSAQIVNKVRLKEEGEQVKEKQRVSVRIWGNDKDRENSIEQDLITGGNQLNQHVQKLLLGMRVGDISEVKLTNHALQKTQNLNIEVISAKDLSDFQNPCLPIEQKAEKIKAQGNAFIKDKKYQQSIRVYTQAFEFIRYACDSKTVELKLSIISNLALATLNMGRFSECVQWCCRHIKESLDPNKKVIYRQAKAEIGMKEWQAARKTISKALEWWKGDKDTEADFKALLDCIEKEEKVQKDKEKKVYKNMFG